MADIPAPVQALMADILSEFPTFKVVFKDESRLMKAVDVFLRVITVNLMKAFLTSFITTVGYTVYVPRTWWTDPDAFEKLVVLRHERIHMRQRRYYGPFLFSFLYLFFPLPAGLAYFRMVFEREAYAESLMAAAELGGTPDVVYDAGLRNVIVSSFVGPSYFWTWPFKRMIDAWYDDAAAAAVSRAKSLKIP